jgi:hypothetical protein
MVIEPLSFWLIVFNSLSAILEIASFVVFDKRCYSADYSKRALVDGLAGIVCISNICPNNDEALIWQRYPSLWQMLSGLVGFVLDKSLLARL